MTVKVTGTVLGAQELKEALGSLPGKVVLKIMAAWTLDQAKQVTKMARASAPRRRQAQRGGRPRSQQMWRSIKASQVRKNLRNFGPGVIARSIGYGAADRFNKSKTGRPRHFHLTVNGSAPRTQKTTGRFTGSMWGKTPNPHFWRNAVNQVTGRALADVQGRLRQVYDRELQKHVNSIVKRYPTGRYP